jgi:PucR C-terminal helix-turn-helix domain/GAF domain
MTTRTRSGRLPDSVRAVGVRGAVGVPVIVDGRVWGLAAVGSGRPRPMPADTEARLGRFAELVAAAVVAGHRDEQKRQLLGKASQRPFLIDSLLEGRVLDNWNLWEVAGYLRLPSNGLYVVVAAEVHRMGTEPLPDIESKLLSLDAHSAWQLLPELQVGIVHVKSDQQLDKVLALVSRMAAVRVDVSARFKDLRDTPHALHFAKVTLRGTAEPTTPVTMFDGSILATAAVSAPQIMVKSVGTALDSFSDLPDEERESLFETFRVWQDASVTAAAERLYCHPNTVRHRLRRIEKYTGRSLSRPRDVAELCLAFEVHRRLFEPKPRGCE